MSQYFNQVAYGLTQALITEAPAPILAKRAPTVHDIKWALGTLWIYSATNAAYVLVSVIANSATWLLIESSGGAGVFSSITATTGPNSLSGGTTFPTGAVTVSVGSLTVTLGNIITGGAVEATGNVFGNMLIAEGDTGTGIAGDTILTNTTVPVAGGTGAFTITSATTSGAATNAGFIKMYIGTTPVFVPYYTTTA